MPQQELSPEKYIRTKARSLPIDACYINTDWKESGLAMIAVIRKHLKGTYTAGFFMIDYYCLGVKECHFTFNKPEDKMQTAIESLYLEGSEKIDYDLVHNIIFNAIDFAQSFDINPPKEFQLCQYLLEEEESVDYIETPVGHDDEKPMFVTSQDYPHNDLVIKKLTRHLGKEGFEVLYRD